MCVEDPKEQRRMEIMKLKRRFLKDRKITSAFYAKSQSRQKIMREVSVYEGKAKIYTQSSQSFGEKTRLPWVGFEPTTHCVLGKCSTN